MRGAPLLALVLVGCAVPGRDVGGSGAAHGPSQGIVSTNPCADAMLVELAPERLTAISAYSHDPAATSLPLAIARRFPATAGTAEEVIALRPALVVTSSFTPPATRAAYARAGLHVLLLDSPTSIAASEAQIRDLAGAVGAPARGAAMIARIERAVVAALPAPVLSSLLPLAGGAGGGAVRENRRREVWTGPPPAPPASGRGERRTPPVNGRGVRRAAPPASGRGAERTPPASGKAVERTTRATTLLFISATLANGPGTLLDELMARAGLPNAARGYGLAHTGPIALERIAAAPPALILTPGPSRSAALRARVLARMGAGTRTAAFPRRLVNCGGPSIVPALARLAALRRSLS